jgi:hypothetical protein
MVYWIQYLVEDNLEFFIQLIKENHIYPQGIDC